MPIYTHSASAARERAARILTDCYDGKMLCREVMDTMQAEHRLSPQDAGLVAELVIGVSRHRITTEHMAARLMRGRFESLHEYVRTVLSMGIYQLCWLDRVPDHAAVDQSVRLSKRFGNSVGALVNAILRHVSEIRGEVVPTAERRNPRRYLPLDARRGRNFEVDIFPDPQRRPLDFLVAVYAHPPYLVERWHRIYKPALCKQICESGQQRPSLILRPNALRTTPHDLVNRLQAAGINAALLDDGPAVIVLPPALEADPPADIPPLDEWDAFREGLFQPQDSTSQAAFRLCPPAPGSFVLDLCAGVGTKSTQAAEMMKNDGLVLATDIDERKLEKIPSNAERLGLSIIQCVPLNKLDDHLSEMSRKPDVILIDAPCSNTGVLARRPEARYRATHKNLLAMVQTQREILDRAVSIAGPETRIVYTTCSIEREENEIQIKGFSESHPGWSAKQQSLILPDAVHGGGFSVLLAR